MIVSVVVLLFVRYNERILQRACPSHELKNSTQESVITPSALARSAAKVMEKDPEARTTKTVLKRLVPVSARMTKNNSTTLPPELGDQYGEDASHMNSTCPDSIRKRIAKTELQHFFLPTIPVLQWKKHATQAEYERLRRYRGAQGWMEVDWHILNETLNLLNSSANGYMFDDWQLRHPVSSPCIRCAIVGNGGILNGSKVGAEIDQHDYVFRVNGAIVKGHEDDVGNRTSFYTFSTNTLRNSLAAYGSSGFRKAPQSQETRYIFLPDHDRDYLLARAALTHTVVDRGRDKSIRPVDFFGQNPRTEQFKMLHPDFMRYLRNRILFSPILYSTSRDIYRASTGAAMLLAALHTCDQVSAYGFITPDYDKYSDHYYDKTYKKMRFYSNHNFKLELELWQKLKKNGIIKLYSRQ